MADTVDKAEAWDALVKAGAGRAARIEELERLLSIIVLNAEAVPYLRMAGTTDAYIVPLDDIEAARSALKEKNNG